jgi:ketosteroid isomerase-like protein
MSVLGNWMALYLRAWESNDPTEIGALFTEDALYFTEPSAEPWRGRVAIVESWLERKDEPGDAYFAWQPLVETAEVGVVTGKTTYSDQSYDNLWVVRFDDDGCCSEFTEWWIRHGGPPSTSA